MQTSSFSFQKLRDAGNTPLAPLESLPASDGVTLRYRLYAPVEPQAVVLFYHGGGAHHGHDYAVRFNSPPQLLRTDPGLVSAITITMSNALIPAAPGDQFEALDRPSGLWIGEEDELFLPEKVLAFADRASKVRRTSEARSIPGARHLSVPVRAHETIGPWLLKTIPGRP